MRTKLKQKESLAPLKRHVNRLGAWSLDLEIREYANFIYEQEVMDSIAAMQREISLFLKKRAAREYQVWTGPEIKIVISAHVKHIERCMACRLRSYQSAFEEKKEIPNEEDLTGILQDFQSIQEQQVKKSTASLDHLLRTHHTAFEGDFSGMLTNGSAHGHDRNLRDWKIWRAKSRVQRGSLKTVKGPHLSDGSNYVFHPEIGYVSGQLYKDGHFKSAVLEAFVCVINRVKNQAKLDERLDGEVLMNHAFGQDSKAGPREPRIRFNSLANRAERDEQRGIMNLFKGICGVRDFKAHTNALFDSPERALEYLALASLLMRLLDIAAVNTSDDPETEAVREVKPWVKHAPLEGVMLSVSH